MRSRVAGWSDGVEGAARDAGELVVIKGFEGCALGFGTGRGNI